MSNIPYLEQLSNNEVVTASKAANLALQVQRLSEQGGVSYPITIDKGGSGQTTQQASINALTNASAATTGQVLQRNSSGNAVFADGVTYPIAIDKGGSGQTTQQASINALTNASAATTNQVLTRNSSGNAVFADALPFKSYMAVISQSGGSAPTATVSYNNLGGTVVWTYYATGMYVGTIPSGFPENKTFCIVNSINAADVLLKRSYGLSRVGDGTVMLVTATNGSLSDSVITTTPIEIRVYN